MKNFKTLFFSLVVALFFVACEGEDDSIKPNENYLIGTWELTEIGYLNSSNIQVYNQVIPDGNCGFDTYTFGENDLLTVTFYSSETADNCDTYIDNGSYNMDILNVDMSYTLEGETAPTVVFATIETLNLTNLILTYSVNGEITFLKFTKM
uniref:hypothetical protein n=1 Tax=Flavobacterium sp. TaxID=239 RepID=UPI004049DCAB